MNISVPSSCFVIFHTWSVPVEDPMSGNLMQTCAKCNKVRFIKRECRHQWEEVEKITITDGCGDTTGHKYRLRCKRCGELTMRRS